MLTDPQSVTIGATPHSLPRVSTNGRVSLYSNADETVTFQVNQITGKGSGRKRHEVSYVQSKVVTDPVSSVNDTESTTLRIIVDRPSYGFSQSDIDALWSAVKTHLSTALMGQIYGGQS